MQTKLMYGGRMYADISDKYVFHWHSCPWNYTRYKGNVYVAVTYVNGELWCLLNYRCLTVWTMNFDTYWLSKKSFVALYTAFEISITFNVDVVDNCCRHQGTLSFSPFCQECVLPYSLYGVCSTQRVLQLFTNLGFHFVVMSVSS